MAKKRKSGNTRGVAGSPYFMGDRKIRDLSPTGRRGRMRSGAWLVLQAVTVLAIVVFLAQSFAWRQEVGGTSMEPALADSEAVFADRLVYHFRGPARGEIVIFRTDSGRYNIKRVAGLPGETVQIDNGRVYVDGSVIEGFFEDAEYNVPGLAASPVTLGDDEYFLLGDNPDISQDSRSADIGNVPRDMIVAKVWLRVSPLDRFGPVS